MKRKVFLLYPYYWPFYKAGGPVQSIYNIASTLSDTFDFFVLSRSVDIDGSQSKMPLEVDKWQTGPQKERIYYSSSLSFFLVMKLLSQVRPDVVMVNGMFNLSTTLPGIILSRYFNYKLVISPRGMLQKGALAVRPVKKKMFLQLFRLFKFGANALWHATDEQEEKDVNDIVGPYVQVAVVPNIPKRPWTKKGKPKSTVILRMIYLSLITEKKNLHVALKSLALLKAPVLFHVYGPIKDNEYWKSCLALMTNGMHEIKYMGSVEPDEVQKKLAEYDLMILPTQGENFGHSIYESLSVGTPALISPFTPWGILQSHNAGITVDSYEPLNWASAIQNIIDLDVAQYEALSLGAAQLASAYFSRGDFISKYIELFEE